MTRGEKTFVGTVFGLTWLFTITYGGYNIAASIVRDGWPEPMIIVGGVVFILGVPLVDFWGTSARIA